MKPGKNQFTKVDYDFSGVHELYLPACCFYEYARESRAVIREVAVKRKQPNQSPLGLFAPEPRIPDPIQNFKLVWLSLTNGFPRKPWRQLSAKDRIHLAGLTTVLPTAIGFVERCPDPPISFALNEPGTTTLDMWKETNNFRPANPSGEPIKYGFVALNLNYSTTILIEEFEGQLRRLQGKPIVDFPPIAKERTKPPGRRSIPDALNALAAMRLRYYCKNFAEVQEKLEATDGMLLYKRAAALKRACNHALRHFQDLFGKLDSEGPIHFPQDGRRGAPK